MEKNQNIDKWEEIKKHLYELDEMEFATCRDKLFEDIDSLLGCNQDIEEKCKHCFCGYQTMCCKCLIPQDPKKQVAEEMKKLEYVTLIEKITAKEVIKMIEERAGTQYVDKRLIIKVIKERYNL